MRRKLRVSQKWKCSCFSKDEMPNTNGELRFGVLANRDRTQIVTNFGRYGQLNIGIGSAGNAYQVGTRLAGLLDIAGEARIHANDNVPER